MTMIRGRTEERGGRAVPRVLEGVVAIIAGTKTMIILARHSSFGRACRGGLGGRIRIIGMDGSRAGRSFEFGRCDGIIIIGARGRSRRSVSL